MRKFLAGSVAVLALAALVPLAATAGDGDRKEGHHRGDRAGAHGGHHGWHGEGHRGGMHPMRHMMETYDTNGDGAVSQAEIDEMRAGRLAEFDADGDGQLSLEEYEALWLDAMRDRMVDRFQFHDDDGDGQVTVSEFGKRSSKIVERHDRNGDGVLNEEDRRGGMRHHGRGEGERGAR
jgi:hypothetical protein